MIREYITRNTRVRVQEYDFCEDASLVEDGWSILVNNQGKATVRFHGKRGEKYARQYLATLTDSEGKTLVGEFEDYPSFPLRGIIEGYYGKPYTWEERFDVVDFASKHKMNAYFYAPKDDRYHRDLWRESYPADQLKKVEELKRYADERDVMFYYCLSPGADFRYTCEGDYEVLLKKFREVEALGVEEFAILFDDISGKLTEEDKTRFSTCGEAHAYVANWLNGRLRRKHKLIICPTDYFQNFDTPYREELRKYLDRDIQVIWTGYNVIAEAIPERDCRIATENFERELVLWDNYPVNDYKPYGRIYMDAVCNRTHKIANYHVGAISNVSELWESSKFMLCSFAEWMWNAENYDYEGAYQRTLDELVGKEELLRFFVAQNRTSPLRVYPDNAVYFEREDWAYLDGYYKKLKRAVGLVKKSCKPALVAEWKGLLHFASLECALYKAFREGKDVKTLLEKIKEEKYHFAEQSIFPYIAQKLGVEDITRTERKVYWETDKQS